MQSSMKMVTLIITMIFFVTTINAQSIISGKVTNNSNEPLASASIRIKGAGAGTHADSTGRFLLHTSLKGKYTLQVSAVGYSNKDVALLLNDSSLYVDVTLDNESKTLGEVVVVGAGSFEASDKAKGASLTPMDAMTVAGNGGDIANSLRSLPGAQAIGEKEGLFVRGGTGEETKQFVDGAVLKNPNNTPVPGMVQGARLNPFLFKGILFSTGGYSAAYGQALSSALVLETVDLPDQSSASLHIFPQSLGVGFQQLAKNNKSSYGINTNYSNLQWYNRVVPQTPGFFHGPEQLEADANFRVKTSKTGMLKFYTNYGYSHTGMRNPDIDSSHLLAGYEIKGTNVYNNLSYRESLGRQWKIDAVIAYNYYKERVQTGLQNEAGEKWNDNNIHTSSHFAQGRTVFTKTYRHNQALRFGAEYFYSNDAYHHNDSSAVLQDQLTALFAEGDIRIARNIAARAGLRAEYSHLQNSVSLAPRISVAYRLGTGSQLNFAYGIFYQKPENRYLYYNNSLGATRATHYIINYQKKAGNRLLRIEAYYKQYNDLITTRPSITNNGDGYAKGIELFWRDKRTFKNFDYWITYTYLDTKRTFLDYPAALAPDFTTPHTASIAVKRFFQAINLSANLSYTFATGRPYYNIRNEAIDDRGTTAVYNNCNLSFAWLFNMFPKWKNNNFSGLGFGINNVMGSRQVFGYRYSYDGTHKVAMVPPAARSYYFGLFMNFGIDRSDDFINNNL